MPRSHRQADTDRASGAVTIEGGQIVLYTLWTAPVEAVVVAGPDRAVLEARIAELRGTFTPDLRRARVFGVPITADVLTSPIGG